MRRGGPGLSASIMERGTHGPAGSSMHMPNALLWGRSPPTAEWGCSPIPLSPQGRPSPCPPVPRDLLFLPHSLLFLHNKACAEGALSSPCPSQVWTGVHACPSGLCGESSAMPHAPFRALLGGSHYLAHAVCTLAYLSFLLQVTPFTTPPATETLHTASASATPICRMSAPRGPSTWCQPR